MKKITMILMAALLIVFCVPSLSACKEEGAILRVHNWGEYMDQDVIDGFADWYFKATGEKVKVKYTEFSINENMYNDIDIKNSEYDLVCPSDYMAEKMIKKGYAKKIDKSIINLEGLVRSDLLELTKAYDENSEYTVPYMWGTLGIMYDITKVTEAEAAKMNSWEALFDPSFSGQLLMKDSIRDAYAVANIYNNRQQLSELSNGFTDYDNAEYRALLDHIFEDVSEETIEAVQAILRSQNSLVKKYEVDDGKDDMLRGDTGAKLGLFWSCDSGYVMNDVELEGVGCCAGATIEGNKNLRYVVPKEGSNVWVDCWIIPAYSKNEKAANYFLKYLCESEVAKANMMYVGSASPIESVMNEYKEELIASDFFTDTGAGFKEMYLEMMFPSTETLLRCAVMKDFQSKSTAINDMWINVKA